MKDNGLLLIEYYHPRIPKLYRLPKTHEPYITMLIITAREQLALYTLKIRETPWNKTKNINRRNEIMVNFNISIIYQQ